MMKDVACHDGKCWEVKTKYNRKNVFEDMFEDGNIVDQIEKDLWLYNN